MLATVETSWNWRKRRANGSVARRTPAAARAACPEQTIYATSCSPPMRWSGAVEPPAGSRRRQVARSHYGTEWRRQGSESLKSCTRIRSPRRPLRGVNCGAIPSELIEAELFGAEPGAYTGAARARVGRISSLRTAGGLFLDEIGNCRWPAKSSCARARGRAIRDAGFEPHPQLASARPEATNADLSQPHRSEIFEKICTTRLNVIEIAFPR